MKVCCRCKIKKSLVDYYSDKRTKDGKRSWCKKCWNKFNKKYWKIWYDKNKNTPEYRKKYNLSWGKWAAKNKDKLRDIQRKFRSKYPKKVKEYSQKYSIKIKGELGVSRATANRYGVETLRKLFNERIRECAWCTCKTDLTIHHKDNNGINNYRNKLPMNNDVDNLEIVCRSCHGAYHSKQKYS